MCISNHNKKEWNLGVLTIVTSLDYEERILSSMCRNGPSLKYRLYVFFSVHKKFDIKQLKVIFTKGEKHKIIT